MPSRHLSRRFFVRAATTSLGVSLLAIAGCGGQDQNTETVVPEVPPEQAAKDSMEYYKTQVAGKKKKVR